MNPLTVHVIRDLLHPVANVQMISRGSGRYNGVSWPLGGGGCN